jgi:hypothetical protein
MTINAKWSGLALGLAGAIAVASPSFAGPVFSNATSLKAATSNHAIDVRWRRGGGIAAGLAFGALAGAAIGAATAPYYYGPGYSGGYYPGYSYGAYAYGSYGGYQCGAYGGYGRWDYSQC